MEYQNENFGGEYDFRCRFHDGWEMAEHIHEYSELLYCKDGEGMVTVNGRRLPIRSKQFVWIPPNYIHRYDCQSARVICAVFSNDMIPLFFNALEGRRFCASVMEAGSLCDLFEGLVSLNKKDLFRISGYLNLILATVFEQSCLEAGKSMNGVLYQKVTSPLFVIFNSSASSPPNEKTTQPGGLFVWRLSWNENLGERKFG